MSQAGRDQNFVPTLLGVSNADGRTPVAVYADPTTHRLLIDSAIGSGTVTTVSVVSANGFAGSVANPTTTPAITLTTTINSAVLAGNGTAISAATTTGSGSTVVLNNGPTLIAPVLGTPASGVATNLTGTASGLTAGSVTTNANLTGPITSSGNATSIASQTGTGTKFVVDTSPTLVTPVLGVATATSINKMAITAPAASSTLAVADGKTFTASNTITLAAGADSQTFTFPSTTATIARTDAAQTFVGIQTIPQILCVDNAIAASGNAATVTRSNRNNVVTNNSAAGITITLSTTSATAGDMLLVQSLPSSNVAQAITWVNTENSDVTPSANLNASTTSPRTDGFKWNPLTSKWRCLASA